MMRDLLASIGMALVLAGLGWQTWMQWQVATRPAAGWVGAAGQGPSGDP